MYNHFARVKTFCQCLTSRIGKGLCGQPLQMSAQLSIYYACLQIFTNSQWASFFVVVPFYFFYLYFDIYDDQGCSVYMSFVYLYLLLLHMLSSIGNVYLSVMSFDVFQEGQSTPWPRMFLFFICFFFVKIIFSTIQNYKKNDNNIINTVTKIC